MPARTKRPIPDNEPVPGRGPGDLSGREGAPQPMTNPEDAIWRSLAIFMADPKRCPRRLCRRARKCEAPASGCPAPQRGNGPRLDAEYLARHQSLLRRAVAREIERREREARRSGHPLAESGKPRASR